MFVGSGSSDCGCPWLVYSNARSKWVLPFLNQEERVTHKIGHDAGAANQWWSHYWLDKVRNVTLVIATSDRPYAHAKIDSYFKHIGLFFVIWLQIWRGKKRQGFRSTVTISKAVFFQNSQVWHKQVKFELSRFDKYFQYIIYLSGDKKLFLFFFSIQV